MRLYNFSWLDTYILRLLLFLKEADKINTRTWLFQLNQHIKHPTVTQHERSRFFYLSPKSIKVSHKNQHEAFETSQNLILGQRNGITHGLKGMSLLKSYSPTWYHENWMLFISMDEKCHNMGCTCTWKKYLHLYDLNY